MAYHFDQSRNSAEGVNFLCLVVNFQAEISVNLCCAHFCKIFVCCFKNLCYFCSAFCNTVQRYGKFSKHQNILGKFSNKNANCNLYITKWGIFTRKRTKIMEKTIKDRLLFFIGSVGENPHSFENLTGLSNGFVKNLNSIGSAAVEKIHAVYPQLSTDWLLFGEGEMLIAETIDNSAENVSGGVVIQGQKILHDGNLSVLVGEMQAAREMYDKHLTEAFRIISKLSEKNG